MSYSKCLILIATVFAFACRLQNNWLEPATSHELSLLGGACENCKDEAAATCVGTTCTDPGPQYPYYVKKVGNNITPMKCVAAAAGADGYTKCTLTQKQACFTYSYCNENCANCSPLTPPADNDKPTKCSTSGGYLCKG